MGLGFGFVILIGIEIAMRLGLEWDSNQYSDWDCDWDLNWDCDSNKRQSPRYAIMGVERNHVFLISEVELRSFQSKCSKSSCNVAFDEKL